MGTRPKPSAVLFVKQVAKLADFYQQMVGMAEIERDKSHVVLETDGFQLVIHGIPKRIADEIQIATPPEVREETPIKVCLPVDSIEAARQVAKALGGQIGDKKKEWEARGFRACDGHDPEGNVFQVRESAS